MATAQDLFDSALRQIGVLASGETPTTQERNDGLITLNQLVSSWNAKGVPIPYLSLDVAVSSGASLYTIGNSLTINTPRPLILKAFSTTSSSVEKGAKIVPIEDFNAIEDKSRTAKHVQKVAYVVTTLAAGIIYVWPAPPASVSSFNIWSYKPLPQFGALGTTVSLPEGYERALRAALSLDLASEYGRSLPPELVKTLEEAKDSIFNLNIALHGSAATVVPPAAPAPPQG